MPESSLQEAMRRVMGTSAAGGTPMPNALNPAAYAALSQTPAITLANPSPYSAISRAQDLGTEMALTNRLGAVAGTLAGRATPLPVRAATAAAARHVTPLPMGTIEARRKEMMHGSPFLISGTHDTSTSGWKPRDMSGYKPRY